MRKATRKWQRNNKEMRESNSNKLNESSYQQKWLRATMGTELLWDKRQRAKMHKMTESNSEHMKHSCNDKKTITENNKLFKYLTKSAMKIKQKFNNNVSVTPDYISTVSSRTL